MLQCIYIIIYNHYCLIFIISCRFPLPAPDLAAIITVAYIVSLVTVILIVIGTWYVGVYTYSVYHACIVIEHAYLIKWTVRAAGAGNRCYI